MLMLAWLMRYTRRTCSMYACYLFCHKRGIAKNVVKFLLMLHHDVCIYLCHVENLPWKKIQSPNFQCSICVHVDIMGVPSAESSRSVWGLGKGVRGPGKGVSGKPYPRLCNARRARLEPGTFRSQAVRLYRLHQARPSHVDIMLYNNSSPKTILTFLFDITMTGNLAQ